MTRTTDLIPSVQERICNALRSGNTARTAATLGLVSEKTYYEWLRRGEAGEEPFCSFRQAVEEAQEEAQRAALAAIQKAANGWMEETVEEFKTEKGSFTKTKRVLRRDWKAASWFLERRNPAEWGSRQKVEHSGSVGLAEVGWAVEDTS